MSDRSEDTYWIELGFLPVDVGYVPNAKAWRASLKRLGVEPFDYPETDGNCTRLLNIGPERKTIILICVGKRARKFSLPQVVGIIAHECQHAWRYIREAMGEDDPSCEFEAYVMQALVQHSVYAHITKIKRPWAPPPNPIEETE